MGPVLEELGDGQSYGGLMKEYTTKFSEVSCQHETRSGSVSKARLVISSNRHLDGNQE